jgi:hemolysin activation/secretion protein
MAKKLWFKPGVLFGDSGWGLSVELSRLLPVFHDFSYFKLIGLQPYGLAEAANTYQNIEITDDNRIRSLALGLRLKTDVAGVMDIAVAKSMTSHDGKVDDDLTLSFNFGFLLN